MVLPKWSGMFERHLCFAGFTILSVAAFATTIQQWWDFAVHGSGYSHSLLIPLLTVILIYLDRARVFADSGPQQPVPFARVLAVSVLVVGGEKFAAHATGLPGALLLLDMAWWAGFLACYGASAFRAARFALLLLLLIVPLPQTLLDPLIAALQSGSAAVTGVLLQALGMPVFRHGLGFLLPGIDLEIAPECSGIQSFLSLLVTAAVAGKFLPQTGWGRLALSVLTFPIAIVKNAARIATLAWLGHHVSPAFLSGNLHRWGGIPFAFLALSLLFPAVYFLAQVETRAHRFGVPRGACDHAS